MPNWCNNTLTVSGAKENLTKIREEFEGANGEPLLFNNHFPIKDDERGSDYWGTSTELNTDTSFVESLDDDPASLTYAFLTAWSPPCGWLEKVVGMFPELEFEMYYSEGGMGFWGVASGSEGEFSDENLSHNDFLLATDEFYKDYIDDVNKMTQEELISFFSSIGSFSDCCFENEQWPDGLEEWGDMYEYEGLAAYIIDRIEQDNLPLFINVDWGYYNKMFRDRLSNGSEQGE